MFTLVVLWYQWTDSGGFRASMMQVRLTRPLDVSRNISAPPSSLVWGAVTVRENTREMWGLVDT